MTVGANRLLHFLVFDRLRTPVTVEADLLNSLIVFITDFSREQLPKVYFINDFVRKLLEQQCDFVIFCFQYLNIDFISN